MSTLTFPLRGTPASAPLKTGIALSATVAIFYGLCTLVWAVAPGQFMSFMNSLSHGMDFSALLKPGSFSPLGFIGALLVMAFWSFLAGTFFGWLRQRLGD